MCNFGRGQFLEHLHGTVSEFRQAVQKMLF